MKKGIISIIICMLVIGILTPVTSSEYIPIEQKNIRNTIPLIPTYNTIENIDQKSGQDEMIYSKSDYGFPGVNFTGWTPPDPIIAAGPEHVVVMTNGAIAFFQKDGTKDFQDEIEDSFGFWGAQGATNFVFDPEVIYDPHTDRFMAMACERAPGSLSFFLLAISDDSDPNGNWHKFRFDVTALAGGDIDSPNIAVDNEAVYLTADFFTGGQKYLVYILEKNPLLSGSTGTITSMLITGSQSYGIPVTYEDAPAMYMIEHFESSTNTKIRLHAITDPLGNPQRVTYDLTVPAYSPPEDPPQKGTTARPETFDSRFWSCVWRDGSLWATHHQGITRVMARWYEIKTNDWPNSGNPEVYQSGDIDPGSGIRTFFTSIAPDGYGNAAMCFARSSPNEYISMARCVRSASDPLGTMKDVVIVKNSSGPYNGGRWGDYSGVSCDPSDNLTFWMNHEYTSGGSTWNTWISSCIANQPPETPSKPSGPASGVTGQTYTYSTSTTDPNDDKLYYNFSWGDGEYSDWLGPFNSGESMDADHNWTNQGTFEVKVKAKDSSNAETDWSESLIVTIGNGPPYPPTIDGLKNGKPWISYTYRFIAIDPDGDDIHLYIDWGDSHVEEWIGPFSSGQEVKVSHTWYRSGVFNISARARDSNGQEGNWSTMVIRMPRTKIAPNLLLSLVERLFQSLPLLHFLLGT